MKRVFDNDMVAHVWAQCSQDDGRSSNGNFYFRGRTLYSYGPHYVVGQIIDAPAHGRVVLLNDASYSVSTRRHMSLAMRATSHMRQFAVTRPGATSAADHAHNVAALLRGATECEAKAKRARQNKDWLTRKATAPRETADEYTGIFCGGVTATEALEQHNTRTIGEQAARWHDRVTACMSLRPVSDRGLMSVSEYARGVVEWRDSLDKYLGFCSAHGLQPATDVHGVPDRVARLERHAMSYLSMFGDSRDRQTIRDKLQAVDDRAEAYSVIELLRTANEASRNHWRLTGQRRHLSRDNHPELDGIDPRIVSRAYRMVADADAIMMRVRGIVDGVETVETSAGAEFPVKHAIRAYRVVCAVRKSGRDWTRGDTGPRLGHFTVDKISARGDVTAGCHFVRWSEIDRLASVLGLTGDDHGEAFDDVATAVFT